RDAPPAARRDGGRPRRAARRRVAGAGRGRPPARRRRRGLGVTAPAGARTWTVLELLRWTTAHFAERGIESARLDAECLLAHALGGDRLRLYVDHDKPVAADERARFRELVRARAGERVPVSILTGRREFWSLPFE